HRPQAQLQPCDPGVTRLRKYTTHRAANRVRCPLPKRDQRRLPPRHLQHRAAPRRLTRTSSRDPRPAPENQQPPRLQWRRSPIRSLLRWCHPTRCPCPVVLFPSSVPSPPTQLRMNLAPECSRDSPEIPTSQELPPPSLRPHTN